MQGIKNIYLEKKNLIKNLTQILIFPIGAIVLEILIKTVFNMGTYLGTFMRNLYQIIEKLV
ncbi:MAG: hypothetical protein PHQ64_02960 [Bacilli bacterium]|nr:hypothetical protein [Bacilli bacterium]